MKALLDCIASSKAVLDALRPLSQQIIGALRKHYDVELTFTSNALEGNTLTLRETAEVIEHGVTVGGKRLRDHLEAVDHHDAVQWMRDQAVRDAALSEATVVELHRRIVARSHPELAGRYSAFPRRIAGSAAVFPNAAKLPALMAEFGEGLAVGENDPRSAFEAHYRLVAIHPFGDGNGRTARLLMNLMLIRRGYPPVAIRLEDRRAYLDALETASTTSDFEPFQRLMHERLADTLDDYVEAVENGRGE